MQIKPGLSFDEKQKQLVASKTKIDSKYISDNPDSDKQVLKINVVHNKSCFRRRNDVQIKCQTKPYKGMSASFT